jgi:hypothetical protein
MSLLPVLVRQAFSAAFGRVPVRDDAARAVTPPLPPANLAASDTAALMIACPSPTREDSARDTHRLRGQFLARQDRWHEISLEIANADDVRHATPSGMPVAELLCYGARSDVVAAAEHLLTSGRPADDAPLLDGIAALEEMLADAPMDPVRSITVAQAHMDIGWAWRGTAWREQVPDKNLEAFEAHFDRAEDILRPFADDCATSPLYLTACCALNARRASGGDRIAKQYEELIALDPANPAPMRALGTYVSPRWYGSHGELELQARRTAALVQKEWGTGGYTWVMFDALAGDPEACANLDADFFIEGLEDILERRPDQHTVNTLAAFCAHTIGAQRTGQPRADAVRTRIAECSHWIVRKHLVELHPLIWAHAAAGFDNNLPVPSPRRFAATGQRDALRVIAGLFKNEIAQGRRIIFTAEGPVAEYC